MFKEIIDRLHYRNSRVLVESISMKDLSEAMLKKDPLRITCKDFPTFEFHPEWMGQYGTGNHVVCFGKDVSNGRTVVIGTTLNDTGILQACWEV